MAGPVIAITENIFPTLDPAMAALARLNPTIRMAKSTSAEDILAVAQRCRRHPGDLCQADARADLAAHQMQGDRPFRAGRRQYRSGGRQGEGHRRQLRAGLLHPRSLRPRHGAAAGADPQDPASNKLVQAGRWEMPAVVPIRRIEGTVLGLIGFGNIPRLVAPKAQGFGMKVIAYDPYAKPELFKAAGVESVDLRYAAEPVRLHLGARAADAGRRAA